MPEQTIHLEKYAPDAKALVAGAQSLADERKHSQVEPIHLLARALDRDRGVAEVFKKAGADPADVVAEAESQLSKLPKAGAGLAYLSSAMLALLARAEREGDKNAITVEHLLNAISRCARQPATSGRPSRAYRSSSSRSACSSPARSCAARSRTA